MPSRTSVASPSRCDCLAETLRIMFRNRSHSALRKDRWRCRARLAAAMRLRHDCSNNKAMPQATRHVRGRSVKRIASGLLASAMVVAATAAMAQSKPPLKLGAILDMSGLYADITGAGSETAAKMAAEDFGGEVLGRKIEIIAADHLNKADLIRKYRPRHAGQSGRRSHHRRRGVRDRARGRRDRQGAQQDHHVQRPGIDPPHQRGLRSLYRALRVRHLRAGQHHRSTPPSRPASTPGSSSPPTMRSARIWKRTPPTWC